MMNAPTPAADHVFSSLGRPDNLPDEIAAQIRQKIVSGEFEPGPVSYTHLTLPTKA